MTYQDGLRIGKKILNGILVLGIMAAALFAFLGLSVMKYERSHTFSTEDRNELVRQYPGGTFISHDLYERCESISGRSGTYRFWYWADGRVDVPGGVFPTPCWK